VAKGGTRFEFGPFCVEPEERRLSRAGSAVALPPKAFDLLVILLGQANRLVRKEELIERLWPGVFVEEVNLAQNVSTIRRALGGDGREAFIQTVAGSGYRFVAPVRAVGPRTDAPVAASENPAAKPASRLLILPFRMLKPDADLDFLAFSLPDALTSALSGLDSVVMRSSLVAARFADNTADVRRIALEAGVDLVVSGTLIRVGAALRVSTQLADAAAGTLIWSHTEQASVDDLFALQDSLVARIADSLSRPLSERDHRQLRHDVPATPRAYEYYLRANRASVDAGSWTVARDLYLQALDEDPRYAPGWTRLARVYRLLGKYRTEDAAANLTRAEDALKRALTLNPNLSMAHNLYAHVEIDRGRATDAMVRLLQQARAYEGDAEILAGLVQACRFCGLLDLSVAAHVQAQRLDASVSTSVMHTYFVMRRYDDAVTSHGVLKGYVYAMALAGLGRGAEALEVLGQLGRQEQRLPSELLLAARTFIEGRRAESLEALDAVSRVVSDPENVFYTARQYALLGAPDKAVHALARSIDGGYCSYEALVDDRCFDLIRARPEVQALLDRTRASRDAALTAFHQANGSQLLGGFA